MPLSYTIHTTPLTCLSHTQYTQPHTHAHNPTHIHTHTYTQPSTHTHVHTHAHTHTHTHATGECGVARGVCICLPASFHKSSRYASMGPCVCKYMCVCVCVCKKGSAHL